MYVWAAMMIMGGESEEGGPHPGLRIRELFGLSRLSIEALVLQRIGDSVAEAKH